MSGKGSSAIRLRRRLLWLISFRAAIVTILLGGGALAQIRTTTPWPGDPFYFLIGLTYALTAAYAVTLTLAEDRRWLVDLQFGLDTCLVSALVLMTGGVTSVFVSLYALPIVAASAVQDRQAGILVGLLSSVLYVGLILAQYSTAFGLLEIPWMTDVATPPTSVALYMMDLGVVGFVAVAGLSGYLADRVNRADASLERASSQIEDLQAFNQHVIESLTSGLATTDAKGRILTFNSSAELITGRAAQQVIGRDISDVLSLGQEATERIKSGRTPSSDSLDVTYTQPSGRRMELAISVAPLVSPGRDGGVLIMFSDVTDAHQLEREAQRRQRLAAVGEMAAGIAHEIRNPLTSMSGSIQILRQDLPLNDEQTRLMDIVLSESERLNDTINAFLSYARPRPSETRRLNLGRVIKDTALLIRHGSDFDAQHRLEVAVPSEPVPFDADESQIRQVVWNLSLNALQAMPTGGCLRLSASTESGAGVLLSVSDEGSGLPADDVDEVFQPFRGTPGKGTGLGLAIVHRIVTDYGGVVRIDSKAGRGTTVNVHLPNRPHHVTLDEYHESTK